MALATSQQLADAAASSKVGMALALAGFFFGVGMGVAFGYATLPQAAKNRIPPEAVIKYELARLPYVGRSAFPLEAFRRPAIEKESPALHAAFDAIPGYALIGGLVGMFLLPFGISWLKNVQIERKADAGRLNRLVPHK